MIGAMVAVKKGALTTVIQYFKVLSILFFTSLNNPILFSGTSIHSNCFSA